MGQQFYVIRNNPAPGTAAEKAKQERDRAKAAKHGKPLAVEAGDGGAARRSRGRSERQQPKKQTKKQRQQGSGQRPAPKPKPEGGTDD